MYYARGYFELTSYPLTAPQKISSTLGVLFVLTGELIVQENQTTSTIGSQEFVFFTSNNTLTVVPGTNEPPKVLLLSFIEKEFERQLGPRESCYISDAKHHLQNNVELKKTLVELMKEALLEKRPRLIHSTYFAFTHLLLQTFNEDQVTLPRNQEDERIISILAEIDQRYTESLSLKEFAQTYFLSESYLSRFFKRQMKTTFSTYLKEVRLNYALYDLKHTDWSITKIAYENGFSDASSFIHAFKQKFSETPAIYRQQLQLTDKQPVQATPVEVASQEEFVRLIEQTVAIYEEQPISEHMVTVSGKKSIGTINHTWQKLINLSYAEDLLDTDMQHHIRLAQKDIGFTYGRVWGVLSSEMIYEGNGLNDFNFDKIDQILDFLLEVQLTPFLELTPKPKVIHKTIDEDVFFQPYSPRERTDEEWYIMLTQFIKHCINRYGSSIVESWYFEVSKLDPNISISYWFDGQRNQSEPYHEASAMKKYVNFYQKIYLLIKKLLPKAKLGGNFYSLSTDDAIIQKVSQEFEALAIQYDFLSMSLFPQNYFEKSSMEQIARINDPDFLYNLIQQVSLKRKHSIFDSVPLIINEWNLTISSRNYINDSLYKNLYLVENHLFTDHHVEMIGYWMLSDIFGKSYDSHHVLSGMTGLISKNGIYKPAYYGFKYLSKLGTQLLQSDNHFIFSKAKEERFHLLCFNKGQLSKQYFSATDYMRIAEDTYWFEPAAEIKLHISLTDIPNGVYRIRRHELSKKQGSIYDDWLALGALKDLRKDELSYLQQTCMPKLTVEEITVQHQQLHFDVHLTLNAFQSIEIVKHY